MKTLVKCIAACASMSCLFLATPAHAIQYDSPIQASLARCSQQAGRAQARCLSIHQRVGRLRLRQLQTPIKQEPVTLRQQRILRRQQNQGENNIRRVRGFDMNRLRMHNRDGGNARRLINNRDEQARAVCNNIPREEKSECIRNQWKALRRGNTR